MYEHQILFKRILQTNYFSVINLHLERTGNGLLVNTHNKIRVVACTTLNTRVKQFLSFKCKYNFDLIILEKNLNLS